MWPWVVPKLLRSSHEYILPIPPLLWLLSLLLSLLDLPEPHQSVFLQRRENFRGKFVLFHWLWLHPLILSITWAWQNMLFVQSPGHPRKEGADLMLFEGCFWRISTSSIGFDFDRLTWSLTEPDQICVICAEPRWSPQWGSGSDAFEGRFWRVSAPPPGLPHGGFWGRQDYLDGLLGGQENQWVLLLAIAAHWLMIDWFQPY